MSIVTWHRDWVLTMICIGTGCNDCSMIYWYVHMFVCHIDLYLCVLDSVTYIIFICITLFVFLSVFLPLWRNKDVHISLYFSLLTALLSIVAVGSARSTPIIRQCCKLLFEAVTLCSDLKSFSNWGLYWVVAGTGWDLPTLWALHWHRRRWHGSVYFIPGAEGNGELWLVFMSFAYMIQSSYCYNLSLTYS